MNKFNYSKEEVSLFKKLSAPAKIQDYLNSISFNFEKNGQTCYSPREVIKNKTAHCTEGAIFAAAVLEYHGHKPFILDLRSTIKPYDYDHVIAVYKKEGCFGAISKTNHAVLRYREPVYKTIRELVMSYFHEYFLDNGKKTLREYSDLLNLNKFNKINWRTSEKNLFDIPADLDDIKHHRVLTSNQIKNLRLADKIEVEAGKIREYPNK
ncbi:MAG TPA: transglutaminase-like domain-containing protein [Parcubacteria group bacterium]|nr:transglutaminase-like domain-containing protein [Parcubacteria group bacterium]